mmetsp:Transcript_11025/g.33816  ORF Transcript_11025/g.33816 Transcript_11025/m.33816 type:complete len:260 (+) Transcript_11025:91-870(+)
MSDNLDDILDAALDDFEVAPTVDKAEKAEKAEDGEAAAAERSETVDDVSAPESGEQADAFSEKFLEQITKGLEDMEKARADSSNLRAGDDELFSELHKLLESTDGNPEADKKFVDGFIDSIINPEEIKGPMEEVLVKYDEVLSGEMEKEEDRERYQQQRDLAAKICQMCDEKAPAAALMEEMQKFSSLGDPPAQVESLAGEDGGLPSLPGSGLPGSGLPDAGNLQEILQAMQNPGESTDEDLQQLTQKFDKLEETCKTQ